jgi:hypothetical protein
MMGLESSIKKYIYLNLENKPSQNLGMKHILTAGSYSMVWSLSWTFQWWKDLKSWLPRRVSVVGILQKESVRVILKLVWNFPGSDSDFCVIVR